ncbi:MAG: Fic family protein, partial [Planctomycetota bacterium]
WPAIEAHFSVHADVSAAAIAESVARVRGGIRGSALAPVDEDVLRYAQAVAARREGVPLGGDGIAGEAWLRCAHATLCGHRNAFGAGRIKPIENFVDVSIRPTRTLPAAAAATLRVALGTLASRGPAGGPRAAFLLYTIAHVHAFQDGNGRLARLVVGAELARVGCWPAILPRRRQRVEEASVFDEAIRRVDLAPIVDWLAGQSRLAASVARGGSAEG